MKAAVLETYNVCGFLVWHKFSSIQDFSDLILCLRKNCNYPVRSPLQRIISDSIHFILIQAKVSDSFYLFLFADWCRWISRFYNQCIHAGRAVLHPCCKMSRKHNADWYDMHTTCPTYALFPVHIPFFPCIISLHSFALHFFLTATLHSLLHLITLHLNVSPLLSCSLRLRLSYFHLCLSLPASVSHSLSLSLSLFIYLSLPLSLCSSFILN